MEADIKGPQRKILGAAVAPLKRSHGTEGIALKNGRSLPFRVARTWSAPAGLYPERFYLVDPETREVYIEGPAREERVWGLQSLTEFTDEVHQSVELTPGTYEVVFSLGGILGGSMSVEAYEADEEQAA